jgi:hypothetical protein
LGCNGNRTFMIGVVGVQQCENCARIHKTACLMFMRPESRVCRARRVPDRRCALHP